MTLTFELNLDTIKMTQCAKYLGRRSFSLKSYRPHTDTHTADRFLYLDH